MPVQSSIAVERNRLRPCSSCVCMAWAVTYQTENHRQLAASAPCDALQHGWPACKMPWLRVGLKKGLMAPGTPERRCNVPTRNASLTFRRLGVAGCASSSLWESSSPLPSSPSLKAWSSLQHARMVQSTPAISSNRHQLDAHYLSASSSLTAAGSVADLLREWRVLVVITGACDQPGAQLEQESTPNQDASRPACRPCCGLDSGS